MVEMRAGLVGWKTHHLRPIIQYYQTLGVALVITPRQISRPPDAFIKRLTNPQYTITSDIINKLPRPEGLVGAVEREEPERILNLAPAGGVGGLEPSKSLYLAAGRLVDMKQQK